MRRAMKTKVIIFAVFTIACFIELHPARAQETWGMAPAGAGASGQNPMGAAASDNQAADTTTVSQPEVPGGVSAWNAGQGSFRAGQGSFSASGKAGWTAGKGTFGSPNNTSAMESGSFALPAQGGGVWRPRLAFGSATNAQAGPAPTGSVLPSNAVSPSNAAFTLQPFGAARGGSRSGAMPGRMQLSRFSHGPQFGNLNMSHRGSTRSYAGSRVAAGSRMQFTTGGFSLSNGSSGFGASSGSTLQQPIPEWRMEASPSLNGSFGTGSMPGSGSALR